MSEDQVNELGKSFARMDAQISDIKRRILAIETTVNRIGTGLVLAIVGSAIGLLINGG